MSLNGLNSSQFPLTLDGLSSLDVSTLTIDGQNVNLAGLVPYQGANQTVDLGNQIIRTTHVASTNSELINKGQVDGIVSNLSIAIGASFLDKITTTPQTVVGAVSYTAQLSADDLLVPATKKANLGSVLSVDANYTTTASDAGVITRQYFGSITSSMGIYQATTTQNFAILQCVDIGLTSVGKRMDINWNLNINEPSYTSSIQLFASSDGTTTNQYLSPSVSFTPSDTLYKVLSGTFVPQYRYLCILCLTANPSGVQTVRWYGLDIDEQGVELTNVTMPSLVADRVAVLNGKKQLVSSGISVTKLDFLDNVSSDIQTQLNGKLNLSGSNANQNIVLGAYKVQSTATPTVDDDLTRKAYVDSVVLAGVTNIPRKADVRAGVAPNAQPGATMSFNFGTHSNNNVTPYSDLLLLNGWTDTSAGKVNLLSVSKGTSGGIRQFQGTYGSATNFSDYYDCVMTDLNSANVTLGGTLAMGANKVTTSYTPVNAEDLTRKGYVDTALALKANLVGPNTFSNTHTFTSPVPINLSGLTVSRVLQLDGSGNVEASGVTTTTLGYLDIGSSLVGLLNTKANLTGGNTFSGNQVFNSGSVSVSSRFLGEPDASPSGNFWMGLRGTGSEADRLAISINGNFTTGVVDRVIIAKALRLSQPTANRVLTVDTNGDVVSSTVTPATLAFLDATSSVQTQLNGKLNDTGDTVTGTLGWSGINVAEFGVGLTKETNAGKIGYNWVAGAGLELVGGGTTAGSRAVVCYDRLGVNVAPVVAFQVSGVASVSGNVGIGTTNPQSVIHLNTSGTHQIRFQTSAVDNNYLTSANDLFAINANLALSSIPNVGRGSCQVILQTPTAGGFIQFMTGSAVNTVPSERMRITGDGTVGIGFPSAGAYVAPLSRFTVNSSYGGGEDGGFSINATDEVTVANKYNLRLYPYVQASSKVGYQFRVNNAGTAVNAMVIGNDGAIGIATANPRATLDVNGFIITSWANARIGTQFNDVASGYYLGMTTNVSARELYLDSQSGDPGGSGAVVIRTGATPTERVRVDKDGQMASGVTGNTLYNLKFANSLSHVDNNAGEVFLFTAFQGHLGIQRNTTRNATTACLALGTSSTEESQVISVKADNSAYMPLSFAGSRHTFVGGVVNIASTGSAVPAGLSNLPGQLVIGGTDRNYVGGWSSGLLAECQDSWEFSVHDSANRLTSFLHYNPTNRITIGRDTGWGVTPVTFASSVTVVGSIRATENASGGPSIITSENTNAGDAYAVFNCRANNGGGSYWFHNSSTRAGDGGPNTATIRNDVGALRLQGSGATGILVATDGACFHASGDNSFMRYGPNPTSGWNAYLHVGATQNKVGQPETAQVITTNGNVHIDAGYDRDVFINYYTNLVSRAGTIRTYKTLEHTGTFSVSSTASFNGETYLNGAPNQSRGNGGALYGQVYLRDPVIGNTVKGQLEYYHSGDGPNYYQGSWIGMNRTSQFYKFVSQSGQMCHGYATGYRPSGNGSGMINISIRVYNQSTGQYFYSSAYRFTNVTDNHTVIPININWGAIPAGWYDVYTYTDTATATDGNDFLSLTWMNLPSGIQSG